MKTAKYLLTSLALAAVTACGGGGGGSEEAPRSVVLLFGDSLTNNNGRFVTPTEHWTERLKAARPGSTFIVSGVGGESTEGALKRLPAELAAHRPTHVVITHGTNDYWRACRGCYAKTQENLEKLAAMARGAGATVILGEMNFRLYGGGDSNAYSVMYQAAAGNTGSHYVNMTSNVPFDLTHYHPDRVHFKNEAQPHLMNSVVGFF